MSEFIEKTPVLPAWRRILPYFISVLTVFVGCVSIYDLFVASPVHETATIVGKEISARSGKPTLKIQEPNTEGQSVPTVPLSFYNKCSPGDPIDFSLTPTFKYLLQISLIQNGRIAEGSTPAGNLPIAIFAFGSLLPILMFVRLGVTPIKWSGALSVKPRQPQPLVKYFDNDFSRKPSLFKAVVVLTFFLTVWFFECVAIVLTLRYLFFI